jgi:ribosomal protein S18 acetylase RimI-like enzyme
VRTRPLGAASSLAHASLPGTLATVIVGHDDQMMERAHPSVDGERRRVELPGSRTLLIRSVRGDDVAGLVALYASLGEEDLYCRFFSGHTPPESLVERTTMIAERGGFGLVAVMAGPNGTSRIVGEASCERLPNGDGELGITVAGDARGWLGPYLLDALVEEAAARGVPNIEADVLVVNRRMLSLLRSRGFAVIDHFEQPAIVRVTIGTAGRVPSWPGTHDRPRLLLEVPGGRWHTEKAARDAGFQVLACPGPAGRWSHCPALRGEPCPLVAGADLVVDAVPGDPGKSLLDAHRRAHPSVPLCVEVPTESDEGDGGEGAVPELPSDAGEAVIIGILQRLANARPDADTHPTHEPG